MSDQNIAALHKRKIEELAQLAMTGMVMSGKHTTSKYTATNAYDLAEAMMEEREKRLGSLGASDL